MRTPSEKIVRIAYADDHEIVRQGISSYIASFGLFSVDIEAPNGKELIRKISKAVHLPDICLLDINMPQMDGYETLIEIKKIWPDMPVLIFTMFKNEFGIIKTLRSGANGYIFKNCSSAELEAALTSVYKTGYFYSSEIIPAHLFRLLHDKTAKSDFSEKEMQLMKYCCTTMSYAQIAAQMGTTTRSVEGYRDNLFQKLNVNSRTSLAIYAIKMGYISLE